MNSSFNIITFDGGGLKGALSITILSRLQEKFPNILSNTSMFGGTSTGSFIALGLAYGLSPNEIEKFYSKENADFIFNKEYSELIRPKYNNDNLKEVLLSIFPENLRMKDLGKLVIVPSFYLGSETSAWKPIFYNNVPNSETENARVIDVAMASSAAPLFFPTYNSHIDGGIIATNPSLSCIVHAIDKNIARPLKDLRVLSIGTGYIYNSIKDDTKDWGAIDWIINKEPSQPIISVSLEGNCQISQMFSQKLLDNNFFRVNPKMSRDISMDDCESLGYLNELGEDFELDDTIKWLKEKWN